MEGASRHREEGRGGVGFNVNICCFFNDVHDKVGAALVENSDCGGVEGC